ncbi:MAG: DUF4924 family protein [Muribaculaceae bacterium]|nr:DUF4924 family protein [Muribaculaceae bacterium]
MLIAQQKRKENIAEYLLYMWQVEDLLRACKLDIDIVDRQLVAGFRLDEKQHHEVREWYDSLLKMMRLENKKEKGHLQININTLIRLNDLHVQLLHDATRFPEYGAEFYKTLPFIVELRARQPQDEQCGELETCFNALYGTLMLKLQGKAITPETQKAIEQISHFIGLLAAYFKKDEEQPLFEND